MPGTAMLLGSKLTVPVLFLQTGNILFKELKRHLFFSLKFES